MSEGRQDNSRQQVAVIGSGDATVGIIPGNDRTWANDGGEYGTLSEIALELRAGKSVVGIKTCELRAPPSQTPRRALEDSTIARRGFGRSGREKVTDPGLQGRPGGHRPVDVVDDLTTGVDEDGLRKCSLRT
jgi:hypothetical protein